MNRGEFLHRYAGEITAVTVNKTERIKDILLAGKLAPSSVIAIGDNDNDY